MNDPDYGFLVKAYKKAGRPKNTAIAYTQQFKRAVIAIWGRLPTQKRSYTAKGNIDKLIKFVNSSQVALNSKPLILVSYKRALEVMGLEVPESLEKEIQTSFLEKDETPTKWAPHV